MTEKTKGKFKMAIETLAFNENTQESLMSKSKKDKNNECFDVQKTLVRQPLPPLSRR